MNTDTSINENIETIINAKKINDGYDHRYNQTDIDFEQLVNITKSFQKMALLKTLEHPTISTIEKLEKINYYSFLFNETMKFNIREGGLYNDWDFEM